MVFDRSDVASVILDATARRGLPRTQPRLSRRQLLHGEPCIVTSQRTLRPRHDRQARGAPRLAVDSGCCIPSSFLLLPAPSISCSREVIMGEHKWTTSWKHLMHESDKPQKHMPCMAKQTKLIDGRCCNVASIRRGVGTSDIIISSALVNWSLGKYSIEFNDQPNQHIISKGCIE